MSVLFFAVKQGRRLVVDEIDKPEVLEVLTKAYKRAGYEIRTLEAANVPSIIEQARETGRSIFQKRQLA